MSEDLLNEVEVINSIYGDNSVTADGADGVYILHLPQHAVALRLQFPCDYPQAPPTVLGTQSSGERKGEASYVVEVFKKAIGRLFQPGEVCLYDAIEEVNSSAEATKRSEEDQPTSRDAYPGNGVVDLIPAYKENASEPASPPPWTVSDVVIEMKSVFVARCALVSSPEQATRYLQNLLDTDKKVRTATHNITAWRIRGQNGVTFQDGDDDGETAAGGRLLHLMQLMDLWDCMVVVTRWYGGHQLGPKRFSIINTVARDAFVKGNFVKEEAAMKKKGKH